MKKILTLEFLRKNAKLKRLDEVSKKTKYCYGSDSGRLYRLEFYPYHIQAIGEKENPYGGSWEYNNKAWFLNKPVETEIDDTGMDFL